MYNWVCGKRFLAFGLIGAIVVAIFTSLAWGSRGSLISIIMQMPFAIIVFRPLLNSRQKKQVNFTVLALLVMILMGFGALTYGRFGDNVNYTLTDIFMYYLSSNFLMFNNYIMDPGGLRYGDRVFPLLRMLFGMDTSSGFSERRLLFPRLIIDDSQFTFFVGDFCLDFGLVFTFLFFLFFAAVLYKVFKKKVYDMGDVLLGLLWYNILFFGFTLFVYAEKGGNIRLLYLLFFIYLFKRFTPNVIKQ